MTSKYIWSEMSPRERDALVAEKVMGNENVCPRFTTDITSAWEVVEMFDRYDVGFEGGYYADVESGHECGDDWAQGYAEAPTAPEAICLAALRAMGVEVEG